MPPREAEGCGNVRGVVGSIAIVVVLLAVGAFVHPGSGGRGPGSLGHSGPAPRLGTSELQNAAKSLSSGGGPARGLAWSCQSGSGPGSVSCGPATTPAPLVATSPNWNPLPTAPPHRYSTEGAYDPLDREVVMFGGWNGGGFMGDTWVFLNGAWSQLHPSTAPSARSSAMMTWDVKDHYALLYGGEGTGGLLSDTWTFVHGHWTHLTPATSPGTLANAGMAYDSNDSYVVLFAGQPTGSTVTAATWTYSGGVWTHPTPAASPAARSYLGMAYDNRDGWIVVFGGQTATGSPLGDTWNFSKGHWTQQAVGGPAPANRSGPALANDTSDSSLILFGGVSTGSGRFADTWSFVQGAWTQLGPASAPSARGDALAVFDSAIGKVFLYGGNPHAGPILQNTWTYRGGVWKSVPPIHPDARLDVAMVYDEADGYVVLFGGQDLGGARADTWTYLHGLWKPLTLSPAPPARSGAAMTFDSTDGYVVLFGGGCPPGVICTILGDTWEFLGGHWSQLFPAYSPSPREWASMADDPNDGYVVLFGGYSASGDTNDTWTFVGGAWTNVWANGCTYCGQPAARFSAGMVYDAYDGYVLLFGGTNATGSVSFRSLSDTWTFLAGNWTNVTFSAGTPPPQTSNLGLAYDGFDGYVLLNGGWTWNGGTTYATSWKFVGGAWSQLAPSTSPPALADFNLAYDAADNSVVLFGGVTCGSCLWSLSYTPLSGATWLY
ncbi:MAG: kelch motif-containing protein [Thermoplasmata archaeon]|nr:kelch motif-containing protein [Thermoplasmata archaeon]